MANPEDIQQEQLSASQQQLAEQSAQNEVLSGVILELAASQAQQGEIEQRQVKREKAIRRRAFIFDRIGSQWDRIVAKKAFVHATNLYEKDRIEQVAQADSGLATAENTEMVVGSLEFIAMDIRKLVNFMMGNKLQEEENRRELFALLKPKKEIKRDEFKEKKYKGFISKAIGFIGGLLFAFTAGVIEGLRAKLAEIFKPLKDRIAKIFKPFTDRLAKFFKPLTDKLKSGRARVIRAFNTMKDILLRFGKTIGDKLKLLKTTLFGPGSKIGFAASIIKNFKEKFGAVSKGFKSTTAVLFKPIKSLMGMLKQFKPMFKKLGFIFGKLLIPLSMLWDFVTGFVKEFKTSEFDNMFMKILDSVLSGIGSIAAGFIGGILDLVKWGLSWVASKLGFEGLSEWLDSFSITDMVKEGMSHLLDMITFLFTDLIPALVAGLKNKAMNPLTAGAFQEGYDKKMAQAEDARTKGKAEREQKAIDSNIEKQQEVLALQKEEGASAADIQETEKTIANLTLDREKAQAIIDYVPGEGGTKSNKAWQEANMNAKDTRRKNEALIAEEQARIDRSNDGKNEYFGFENNGVSDSLDRIEVLKAEIDEADRVLDVKSRKLLMNKSAASGEEQDDKEIEAGGVQKARLDFDKYAFGSAEKDESIKSLFMKKGYKEDAIDLNNLSTGQRMMLDKRGILKDQSRLKAEAKDTSLEETAVKSNMLKGALSTTADQPNLLEKMVSVAKIPLTAEEPSTNQYLGAISKSPLTDGAKMEAIQDDTLDAKSAAASKAISPIITTTDASSNTTNSVNKTVNQLNHFDKTMMMGYGQALMQ